MTNTKNQRVIYACMKRLTTEQFIEKTRQVHELRRNEFTGWTECFPINMLNTLKEEFERLT